MIDAAFWHGRKVFVTGHTGFKGGWMALLLSQLRAEVYGFAQPPDDPRCIFVAADVQRDVQHRVGDVRDLADLRTAIDQSRPEIVIHLAAQALVRESYARPIETYMTNAIGTLNVLEAVRNAPSVRAVVIITSDKCYEDLGTLQSYREIDRLGGHDPYSSSKACAELITMAYRNSFFQGANAPAIATGRAGNVIGGGDWALDRLVPDAIAAFMAGEVLLVRNPSSVRPWQHVLDPIIGYVLLAQRLVTHGISFAKAWNFGPSATDEVTVERVVNALDRLWPGDVRWNSDKKEQAHESSYLMLDSSMARTRLGWQPLFEFDQALQLTVDWYYAFMRTADMRSLSLRQVGQALDSASSPSRDRC